MMDGCLFNHEPATPARSRQGSSGACIAKSESRDQSPHKSRPVVSTVQEAQDLNTKKS